MITIKESFAKIFRGRGIRVTAQRLAVYEAVAADRTHPTPEAVYARLRPRFPSLSPATVYRILDSFEAGGLVRRVSTTSGVARFDANLEAHQHLVCRVCGLITDIQAPELARPAPAGLSLGGFEVEGLDVRLVGRCARCRKGAPRPANRTRSRKLSQPPGPHRPGH